MVTREIGRASTLVDLGRRLSEAQALNVTHGTPLAYPLPVRAGDYPALSRSAEGLKEAVESVAMP